ncbi:MAG: DUF3783 domain-containing protein [Intestinimonas sp.]|nr:DUF3783 domain-containing protein [Intestinimonas sp.]
MEKVLYYSPVPIPGRAAAVFVKFGIRMRRVTKENAGQTVGFLLGISGCAPASGPVAAPFTGSTAILVFYGLSGQRLDMVLAALYKVGIPRSVLKAVVTPDNQSWTFARLCAELQAEHQALS